MLEEDVKSFTGEYGPLYDSFYGVRAIMTNGYTSFDIKLSEKGGDVFLFSRLRPIAEDLK